MTFGIPTHKSNMQAPLNSKPTKPFPKGPVYCEQLNCGGRLMYDADEELRCMLCGREATDYRRPVRDEIATDKELTDGDAEVLRTWHRDG